MYCVLNTLAQRAVSDRNIMANRYSGKQKIELNRLIADDFAEGLTFEEIAKKRQISTASIYRWKREEKDYITKLDTFLSFELEIEKALNIVTNHKSHDVWALREALFCIAVWLRWPTERHTQKAMMITCVCQYLRLSYGSTAISDLDDHAIKLLFKYVDLEFLGALATPDAPMFDFFNLQFFGNGYYSEADFLGDLTGYILSPKAISSKLRKFVLFDEIYYLIERKVFGPRWVMSRRTFQKIWSTRAVTLPFLYVSRHDKNRGFQADWEFEPQSPNFKANIDSIIENIEHVRRYLSHCRWASETMLPLLHPRTAQNVRMLNFPDNLESMPLLAEPLTPLQLKKIKATGG